MRGQEDQGSALLELTVVQDLEIVLVSVVRALVHLLRRVEVGWHSMGQVVPA